MRQLKEGNQGIQTKMENVKGLLSADDMVVYVSVPKNYTRTPTADKHFQQSG